MSALHIEALIVGTHVNELGGAAFRRIHFFIKYLARNGINSMCLGFPTITINGVMKPNKRCLSAPVPLAGTRSTLVSSIVNTVLSLFLVPYLLVLKPKVVVLSVPDYYLLIPIYLASKLMGAKLVIDFRDPQEEVCIRSSALCGKLDKLFVKRIIRKVNYAIYGRADAVMTVTETARKILEGALGVRVFVAPNGADLEIFNPIDRMEARRLLRLRDEDFVVVYAGGIGGFGSYYRPLELLKITKKLESKYVGKRVKLLLAGPIFDRTYERTLLERRVPNLVYLGILDIDKLKISYSAADLGLIPRVDDPAFDYALPVKFYEYIAMGLPVLALCRRESELARIIIENKLGYVCDPSDEACIKNAIETLALNPSIYSEFRENALRYRKHVDRRIGGAVLTAILKYLVKH